MEIPLDLDVLANALEPVQDFVKMSNQIVEDQLGAMIEKKAQETVDHLIMRDEITPDDREVVLQKLIFEKQAAFDGLIKLAEKVDTMRKRIANGSLGESIKTAGVSGSRGELDSNRIWREGYANLRM